MYHRRRTEYLITSDGGMGPMKSRQPAVKRKVPNPPARKRLTDKEFPEWKYPALLLAPAGRFFCERGSSKRTARDFGKERKNHAQTFYFRIRDRGTSGQAL